MEVYQEGRKLKENEYLLKVRNHQDDVPTGFMTKFNKDGSMPVAFKDWGKSYYDTQETTTYFFEEKYLSGWKIYSYRIGKSQSWATMEHPLGFTVEIYLEDFWDIITTHNIDNCEIDGVFKWEGKKLIEKE